MTACSDLARLVESISPRVTPLDDETCLLVTPVDGLDSHPIHFYARRQERGWLLTDAGHLASELAGFGISEDRVADRLADFAGDLPVELASGNLEVWIPADDPRLAERILRRSLSVILGVWALRADQQPPSERTTIAGRLAREIRATRSDAAVTENVRIEGASRIERVFHLQVGAARRQPFHLVRTSDTHNRSQLHQSAELYLVYAEDLRRLPSFGSRWEFFFVWNDEAARLDRRVTQELLDREILPIEASRVSEAAARILESVPA